MCMCADIHVLLNGSMFMYVLLLVNTNIRMFAYVMVCIFTYLLIFPLSVGGKEWYEGRECEKGRVGASTTPKISIHVI